MRSIEIENLGPHIKRSIQFNNKLHVLHGPHGSGKSTIVNAITIAKYGETPRFKRKRDLYQLVRAGTGKARLSFTENGRVYRATVDHQGRKGTKVSAAAIDKVQMAYPWEALTQKASVWKDMLGSMTLSSERFEQELYNISEETKIRVRKCLAHSLEDTIGGLELLRTELYRQASVNNVEPVSRVRVSGQEIDLNVYLPAYAHYTEKVVEITSKLHVLQNDYQAEQYAWSQQEANNNQAELQAWYDASYTYSIVETITALDAEVLKHSLQLSSLRTAIAQASTELCSACKQPYSVELPALKAEEDAVRQKHTTAMGHKNKASRLKELQDTTPKPKPVVPAAIKTLQAEHDQHVNILKLLDKYKQDKQAAADAEVRTQYTLGVRKEVQELIKRLRDPEIANELSGGGTLAKVQAILTESCSILGLPDVYVEQDLTITTSLPDGSRRDTILLSDTQRALAGLALTEAFARVLKKEMLIIDQIDWVHGEYVAKLIAFTVNVSQHHEFTLLLTANAQLVSCLPDTVEVYTL